MQKLLQEIKKKCFINKSLEEKIKENFKLITTKKNDVIQIDGNRAKYLFFIEKGIFHSFYYFNGKKKTSWFYSENQFVSSWISFYSQKPSEETIESLEDGILYKISYSDYQKLIKEFPEFNNFARTLSEEILVFLGTFIMGWSSLTAKEKYQLLLSYSPSIELRVKLVDIASFLGITKETLSRIRAGK